MADGEDELDEYIAQLGIEESSGEIDNTGCQHVTMMTDGMRTWCLDCPLEDLA